MPPDYLKYLLSLTDAGAHFADQKQITVGGRAATIVTATTDRSLNGTVGCPELGQKPGECFGLQPDLSVRMAVVPFEDKVLLTWLRIDVSADPQDTAAKVASFEGMLASLAFTGGAPSQSASSASSASSAAPHSVTPVDGTWTATTTYEELEHSPLLYDSGEVNDENWGAITIAMSRGKGTQRLVNPKYHGKGAFDYAVDGDVLTILVGTERFAFRWTITDDKLRLTRDDSLGPSPTGWLLKPFVRKS